MQLKDATNNNGNDTKKINKIILKILLIIAKKVFKQKKNLMNI